MTKAEAQAVDVLLDWVFSKKQYEPDTLKHACVRLAWGAHVKGAKWSPARVQKERW